MSEENELNESEMDQLLRDLERKASKNAKNKDEPKEAQPKKSPKKENRPKKKENEKTEDPKPKKETPETPSRGVSVVSRGSSDSLKRKLSFVLFLLVFPLAFAAIWMLGNYLAIFVSAGWLIALVSAGSVLIGAYFIRKIVSKGRYMLWLGLTSILVIVVSLLPANLSSSKMTEFGHWPASSIGQLAGFEEGNSLVSFSSQMAHSVARFRLSFEQDKEESTLEAKKLGGDIPLFAQPEDEKKEDQDAIPTTEKKEDLKDEPKVKAPDAGSIEKVE